MNTNSNEIEQKLNEIDIKISEMIDSLDLLQSDKHNKEVLLMELCEVIRKAKKLLSKARLEKEMLERQKWVVLKQERGY